MGMGSRMSMTAHLPRCEIGWHFVVEIEVESNGFRFQNRFIHHRNEKTSRGSTGLTVLSLSSLTWLNNKIQFLLLLHIPSFAAAAAASSAQFPDTQTAPVPTCQALICTYSPSSSQDPCIKRPSSLSLQKPNPRPISINPNSLQFPNFPYIKKPRRFHLLISACRSN